MLWQINQFLKPDYPFPAFFPPPVVLEHGGHCQAVGRKVTVHTRGGEATQQVISDPDPETGWEPTSSSRETDFPLSPVIDLCCQQTLTRQKNKGSNHFNCADFSSENGLYRHNSIALVGSQPAALTPIFSLGVPRSHFYRILPHLLIYLQLDARYISLCRVYRVYNFDLFKVHCFWRFFSIPSPIRKPQPGHPPVGPCLILMHNAHEDLIKCKYYIWLSDLFSRSYFA